MKESILPGETIASLCLSLSHLTHAGIGVGDALSLLHQDEQDRKKNQLLVPILRLHFRCNLCQIQIHRMRYPDRPMCAS